MTDHPRRTWGPSAIRSRISPVRWASSARTTTSSAPSALVAVVRTATPTPLFTDLVGPDASTADVSLPSEVVWNDVDERLYVVDEIRRGLVPVSVSPLSPLRSIE